MTLAYVYEITDTITGKWYVGSRTAKGCCPEELGVRYFTSSRAVSPMYRLEPSRFKSKIIIQSEDTEYIIKVESSMLKFRNAKDDLTSYNMYHEPSDVSPSKAGKLGGRINVLSGHMEKIRSENMESNLSKMRSHLTIELCKEGAKKAGKIAKESGQIYELQKKTASAGGKVTSAKLNAAKFECAECKMVCNTGGIVRHQLSTGHIGKERVK